MPIKITKNFDLGKKLPIIQRKYLQKAPNVIRDAILAEMNRGKSPVKDGRWDSPYSESYLKTIQRYFQGLKKPSPVNLKLSGQMHSDLRVDISKKNSLLVHFDGDSERIAGYHNEGAYNKQRQILPSNPEERFNSYIETKMDEVLFSVVNSTIGE